MVQIFKRQKVVLRELGAPIVTRLLSIVSVRGGWFSSTNQTDQMQKFRAQLELSIAQSRCFVGMEILSFPCAQVGSTRCRISLVMRAQAGFRAVLLGQQKLQNLQATRRVLHA